MTRSFAFAVVALALSAGAALASPAAAPVNKTADPALQGSVVVSAAEAGNRGSNQLPIFNYRGAVPGYGSAGGVNTQNCAAQLFPSVTCLVHQTGGGH